MLQCCIDNKPRCSFHTVRKEAWISVYFEQAIDSGSGPQLADFFVGKNDRNMLLYYFRGGNDGNLLLYLTSEKFLGDCNYPVALCSVSVIAGNKASLQAGLRSRSRKESEIFGWSRSRIPDNTGSRSRFFCRTPTPDVQFDHFSHHTPKLGIPVEMVQFPLKLLLKQRFLAVVYHDFHWF